MEEEVLNNLAIHVGWHSFDGILSPGGSINNLYAVMIARQRACPGANTYLTWPINSVSFSCQGARPLRATRAGHVCLWRRALLEYATWNMSWHWNEQCRRYQVGFERGNVCQGFTKTGWGETNKKYYFLIRWQRRHIGSNWKRSQALLGSGNGGDDCAGCVRPNRCDCWPVPRVCMLAACRRCMGWCCFDK